MGKILSSATQMVVEALGAGFRSRFAGRREGKGHST